METVITDSVMKTLNNILSFNCDCLSPSLHLYIRLRSLRLVRCCFVTSLSLKLQAPHVFYPQLERRREMRLLTLSASSDRIRLNELENKAAIL